jgi:hypothetical protein
MLTRLLFHARHNVVAYLALFVALGGTAVAAKPLITGDQIANDTVTGDNIVESTLANVDAGTLDGQDSTAFLGASAKAADSDLLDGQNSTAFLGASAKAADSDLLDGQNSTDFLGSSAKAADSDLLDGKNSTAFLGGNLVVRSADFSLNDGSSGSGSLDCNSGEMALGGGVALLQGNGTIFSADSPVLFSRAHAVLTSSGVPTPRGWEAAMTNNLGSAHTMRVSVICTS